jgi:hypothetical protein
MFLTPEELEALTGYGQKAKQAAWLRDRRYPFELGADGRPRVLRSYVEKRLGDSTQSKREPALRTV